MFDSRNPFFKQVHLLVKILPLVNRQKVFALKGGTAINLFIRNLPRLSVDIDLVYLPVNDREKALAEIQHCLKVLASCLASRSLTISSLVMFLSRENKNSSPLEMPGYSLPSLKLLSKNLLAVRNGPLLSLFF